MQRKRVYQCDSDIYKYAADLVIDILITSNIKYTAPSRKAGEKLQGLQGASAGELLLPNKIK